MRIAPPPSAPLAATLAAIVLVGCSGENGSMSGLPGSVAGGAGVTTESTGGSAFGGSATGGNDKSQGAFNPFSTEPASAAGGREVIANPTEEDIRLTGALPDMSLGSPDARVTVVQYASLTCPHCRAFHADTFPEFKAAYIDTGKVRYVLREFPIGKQSGNATIALRCAKPDRYFDLYGRFMAQQAAWVSQEVRLDPIFAVAKQVGMTRAQFDACLKNQGMIEGLTWVKERGRKLGVIGTPNFFIGGKLVKTTPNMAELKALIDPLLKAPATAAAATQQP